MEIDRLGQYTKSRWLLSLSPLNLINLYTNLEAIWSWRGNLRISLKRRIYPFGDPFINRTARGNDLEYCTLVMENLVYSGIDIEDRKIGALHVISALTSVSIEARIQYDWLYETAGW
jgi:hypothetical protein